jgi:hypothetical protein
MANMMAFAGEIEQPRQEQYGEGRAVRSISLLFDGLEKNDYKGYDTR